MTDTLENGRVTLAVIRNDILHLTTSIAALAASVTSLAVELHQVCTRYEERLGDLEIWKAGRIIRWDDHEKEHERESVVLKAWSLIGSAIATVVASIVGVFVKP